MQEQMQEKYVQSYIIYDLLVKKVHCKEVNIYSEETKSVLPPSPHRGVANLCNNEFCVI